MHRKYILLLSFFLLFQLQAWAQRLTIDDLLQLKEKSLGDFQEQLFDNNFLLYKTKSNSLSKVDSVLFIDQRNLIIGRASSRFGNTIFLEHMQEDYFRELSKSLSTGRYTLVSTDVLSEDRILKRYISIPNEIVFEFLIRSNSSNARYIENEYMLIISKDPKFKYKYRKYLKN